MAIQAVLSPSPLQLLAKLSPDSSAVVWKNTYLSRSNRMARAWVITAVVGVLTVFWSLLLVPVAGALNIETIRKVFPQLAEILASHPTAKSLVQTQLPTLIAALLNVTVPYLYECTYACVDPFPHPRVSLTIVPLGLSNSQGMISQADVELSLISKNFFFTFFNFFIIFTTLGTASNFLQLFLRFRDSLREPAKIAFALAVSLQELQVFYVNYIILQGLGLFPLKLIEAGSATLFHVYRLGAKTPRGRQALFHHLFTANRSDRLCRTV